jgi:RNA polymerase sigma factor for flagellar operon FliA
MNEEELIKQYLPLVDYIVNQFRLKLPKHYDIDELYSIGRATLMQLARKFDLNQENTFTAYAILRIRGAIQDELRSKDCYSRRGRTYNRQIKKATDEVCQKLQRNPTDNEIREHLGLNKKQYARWIEVSKQITFSSLDIQHDSESGGFSLHDLLVDENDTTGRDNLEKSDLLKIVAEKIEKLPEKQKNILTMFYFDGKTTAEIGKKFNVSRTRITQINREILFNLKEHIKQNQ